MNSNSKAYDASSADLDTADLALKEILEPVVLSLVDKVILADTASTSPLYQLSHSEISSSPKQNSTVILDRVEHLVQHTDGNI